MADVQKPAPAHLDELDKQSKALLELAIKNLRNGPVAFKRSGITPARRHVPWVAPAKLEVSHAELGDFTVDVETGEIQAKAEIPVETPVDEKQ